MADTFTANRKGRKFDEVIEGARAVFMRDGFDGASVDDIAREAGVSKATLYSYFPDKRVLFLEIVSQQCKAHADAAFVSDILSVPARDALTQAADLLTRFLVSPLALAMNNLIHGEARRFPELAQEFYKSGPQLAHSSLIKLFHVLCERGELVIDDPDFAAEQFGALCKADVWVRCCLCVEDAPPEADIQKVINGAVDTFLARYGAK